MRSFLQVLALCVTLLWSKGALAQSDSVYAEKHRGFLQLSAGVYLPNGHAINANWQRSQLMLWSVGVTSTAPLGLFARASVSGIDSTAKSRLGVDSALSYRNWTMQMGLSSFIPLNKRILVHMEYGLNLSIIDDAFNRSARAATALGWVGGMGVYMKVGKNTCLFMDADYQYLSRDRGGWRIAPGIAFGFTP